MNNQTQKLALATELASVKNDQNILAALSIYHPNAEMIAPSFDAIAKGSNEIEHQLNLFFSLFPDYSVELEEYAFNDNVMLATGKVSLSVKLPEKTMPSITLPVFMELHFFENRISKEIFNLDVGMICQKSGVSPEEIQQAFATYHESIKGRKSEWAGD